VNPIDDISRGAWTRLRNVLITLDRGDRLDTGSEFIGWLPALTQDQAALEATMREFILRAVHLATDPINACLLSELNRGDALTVRALMTALHLARVELIERLNELARAGLIVQAFEGEPIEPTPLARGWLALMDEMVVQMQAQAHQDATLVQPSHRRWLE